MAPFWRVKVTSNTASSVHLLDLSVRVLPAVMMVLVACLGGHRLLREVETAAFCQNQG